MANFHSDEWVRTQIEAHLSCLQTEFSNDQIVGVFCQGSTNYGLDIESSDVDTKSVVLPTFDDIIKMKRPVSTTLILDNDEHIETRDIRLWLQTFCGQSPVCIEILFTNFFSINPLYANQWERLIQNREAIAHMNPYRAVKAIKGFAEMQFELITSSVNSINFDFEKGYNVKQALHVLRLENLLKNYLSGMKYENCLIPNDDLAKHLIDYKLHKIPLEKAKEETQQALGSIREMAKDYCSSRNDEENLECRWLLEDVTYNIMKIATLAELHK